MYPRQIARAGQSFARTLILQENTSGSLNVIQWGIINAPINCQVGFTTLTLSSTLLKSQFRVVTQACRTYPTFVSDINVSRTSHSFLSSRIHTLLSCYPHLSDTLRLCSLQLAPVGATCHCRASLSFLFFHHRSKVTISWRKLAKRLLLLYVAEPASCWSSCSLWKIRTFQVSKPRTDSLE